MTIQEKWRSASLKLREKLAKPEGETQAATKE